MNYTHIFSKLLKSIPKPDKVVLVSVLLIIILGFSVYINVLNGEFIWDDNGLVKDNIHIKDWSYVSKGFTESIWSGVGREGYFYRPLQVLSYMVDYSFWKLDVRGYHLTNILLHILVALAVYWFIHLLFNDKFLSLLTSAFFVVHPIHTEAISYISGRADPLAALFMLLCFICYIKQLHTKSVSLYFIILLSYTLALLSKEYSLILPLLILLYHYTFKKRIRAKDFFPILGVASTFIVLRLTILKLSTPHLHLDSLLQRIPGFFIALANYLRIMVLPFHLHMAHGKELFSFTNPQALVGAIILVTLLIYTLKIKNSNSLIFFSISWFFIGLLPVSNLYPLNAYMAEHWLYLPSIGFFIILSKCLSRMYRAGHLRIFTAVFIVGLLFFYSNLTIKQNEYWRSPIVFYKRTLRYAPDNNTLLNNLANAYRADGRYNKAIILFEKLLEGDPSVGIYSNLGLTYHYIGQNEKAVTLFKKAIEVDSTFAAAYNNLGNAYICLENNKAAIDSYKQAIELEPEYVDVYYNLGIAYKNLGKSKKAIASFKKAVELNSKDTQAYNNLAVVYYDERQYNLAVRYYDKAVKLGYNENLKFLEMLKPHRK